MGSLVTSYPFLRARCYYLSTHPVYANGLLKQAFVGKLLAGLGAAAGTAALGRQIYKSTAESDSNRYTYHQRQAQQLEQDLAQRMRDAVARGDSSAAQRYSNYLSSGNYGGFNSWRFMPTPVGNFLNWTNRNFLYPVTSWFDPYAGDLNYHRQAAQAAQQRAQSQYDTAAQSRHQAQQSMRQQMNQLHQQMQQSQNNPAVLQQLQQRYATMQQQLQALNNVQLQGFDNLPFALRPYQPT